jgi:quercetin dioxygenase-like cupin family protein
MVHTETMTLAEWVIDAGAAIPQHAHPGEQVTRILEGRLELRIAGESRTLGPGDVAVMHSNVPHAGRALTPCRIIDVWHPAREDYRAMGR